MIVVLERVETPGQAEELRKLRNQCREWMTGDTAKITKDAQRAFYRLQIAPGKVKVLLLRIGGEAVAYGALRPGPDGRLWMSCGVAEQARGKGYGTAIVREITRWGHELNPGPVMLEVRQDNWTARRVYARAGYGFTEAKTRGDHVIEIWEHRQ